MFNIFRKVEESCGNCRYMRDGTCRFRAPVLYRRSAGGDLTTPEAEWPPVYSFMWCGAWQKRHKAGGT